MSQSVDNETTDVTTTPATTVVIQAYNVLQCRVVPFVPQWMNPSYTRMKHHIDAILASNSILVPNRVSQLKSHLNFVTDILSNDLLTKVTPGTYHVGQTIRFTFDATALEDRAEPTARFLAQQLTGAENIEIIN